MDRLKLYTFARIVTSSTKPFRSSKQAEHAKLVLHELRDHYELMLALGIPIQELEPINERMCAIVQRLAITNGWS